MAGFLGKTLGAEELWRVLLNVNWCVNGHCDLWRSPPWESGEVFTDLVLCPLFFPPVPSKNPSTAEMLATL